MNVTYIAYQPTEFLCQLSLLAFIWRVLDQLAPRSLLQCLAVFVSLFGMSNTLVMLLQCQPLSYFWDGWKNEMEGACKVDVRLWGLIRGAIQIVLDLVIFALPLPVLSKIQMPLWKKVQVMSIFSVGFV